MLIPWAAYPEEAAVKRPTRQQTIQNNPWRLCFIALLEIDMEEQEVTEGEGEKPGQYTQSI